jgi:hypothetical protein
MSRSQVKKEAICKLAEILRGYGFRVSISKTGEYGYYTDAEGTRVCSISMGLSYELSFSGNYHSKASGTGWRIQDMSDYPTKEQAEAMLYALAPRWATTEQVRYATEESHHKFYGQSSGYERAT